MSPIFTQTSYVLHQLSVSLSDPHDQKAILLYEQGILTSIVFPGKMMRSKLCRDHKAIISLLQTASSFGTPLRIDNSDAQVLLPTLRILGAYVRQYSQGLIGIVYFSDR